MNTIKWD